MKSAILNWVLGVTGAAAAIGLFFKTYGARILKILKISRDIIDLLDDVSAALTPESDGKTVLTATEIETLQARINKLRGDLK